MGYKVAFLSTGLDCFAMLQGITGPVLGQRRWGVAMRREVVRVLWTANRVD